MPKGERTGYNAVAAISKAKNDLEGELPNKFSALSEDEIGALLQYKSSESYKINAKLRRDIQLTAEEQQVVEQLDRALEKLPVFKGTVYRNIIFDDISGQKDSKAFLDQHPINFPTLYKAYTSASASIDGYPVEGENVVHIIIPNSTCGRIVDGFGNDFENEIIYPRESYFITTRITYGENGTPTIYLQEVNENGYVGETGGIGKGEH